MKRARKKSWGASRQTSRTDSAQPTRKKQKKLNKLAVFGISVAAILVMAVGILGISSLFDQPENPSENYVQPVEKASGKTNVLVLGVDKQGLLTDTMIIASYNTDENEIKLLSIPRDTRMYIGSHYQKINAAFAVANNSGKDGAQGSVEAVSRLTGIPINYYVKFSTTALRDLVDALDGVEFDVPQNMDYEDPTQDLYIHLKKGFQTLDGDKAEQLLRFRSYRDGDIGRVKVQQQFLQALVDQKLNAGILQQIPDLYEVLQKNIDTNAKLTDVMGYVPNLLELSTENITMFQVPGGFNDIDYGASYWIPDMPALRTLVEDEFGYDASQATIHRPGVLISDADKPRTPAKTAAPTDNDDEDEEDEIDYTESPEKPQKPTKNPTQEPDESTDEPAGRTEKPEKTVRPTRNPEKTQTPSEPDETQEPARETEAPTRTPVKTSSPDRTPQKPTANPVQDAEEE